MDKLAPAQGPFFALPGHAVLALEGRDAIAFAQAQCMSDVAALADGEWHWSGWLSPKGRVQALFALLRVGPGTVWLLLPDGGAPALAEALGRFVFRAKVRISVPAGVALCGAFAAPAEAAGGRAAVADGRVELDMGDAAGPRTLRACSHCGASADPEAEARWKARDLAAGLPRAAPGALEAWTPQQLSLDRLRAYSVRKGCYPGQEIVARTHFLGQAKRALALFGAPAAAATGSPVVAGGREIGAVVASAPAAGEAPGHGQLLLAVLPADRDDAEAPPTVDGHPLAPLALREGLAR